MDLKRLRPKEKSGGSIPPGGVDKNRKRARRKTSARTIFGEKKIFHKNLIQETAEIMILYTNY